MNYLILTPLLLIFVVGCGQQKKRSALPPAAAPVEKPAALPVLDTKRDFIPTLSEPVETQPAPTSKKSEAEVEQVETVPTPLAQVPIYQDPIQVEASIFAQTKPAARPSQVNKDVGNAKDPINTEAKAKEVQQKLDREATAAEGKDTKNITEAEKEKWQQLVDYVADKGVTSESRSGFYVSLSEKTSENRFESHIANHISVVGGPNGKGGFAFTRVEAVWEKWELKNDGLIDGDQWLLLISRDGNIAKFLRYHFIKQKDDRVLTHESIDITADQAAEKWKELRAGWYKRIETTK